MDDGTGPNRRPVRARRISKNLDLDEKIVLTVSGKIDSELTVFF
jgi:hypothetical protein